MGFMYSWSSIRRVLFSVAKLPVYMYTYNKVNFSHRFWVVSMTSVSLGDVAECCSAPFSHCTVHIRTGFQEQVLEHH